MHVTEWVTALGPSASPIFVTATVEVLLYGSKLWERHICYRLGSGEPLVALLCSWSLASVSVQSTPHSLAHLSLLSQSLLTQFCLLI